MGDHVSFFLFNECLKISSICLRIERGHLIYQYINLLYLRLRHTVSQKIEKMI